MKPIFALSVLCVLTLQLNAQVSFNLSSTPTVGNGPYSVCAADVNGDGWMDLISVNFDDNTLTVLTNNGSGGFALSATYPVGINPEFVCAADVNGDGWMDLICANANGGTLTVLTNNGSGGFALSSTYTVGGNPVCVCAADVNGDGKLDLICANYGANTLIVLTNNRSGGFALSSTYTVGHNVESVCAADVNGDGWVDLMCVNAGDNTLTVLTNDGSGGFVLSSTYTVGSPPCNVCAADVNGDGWVDLICANYGANTLTVLTNNGRGGFVLSGTYSVGIGPCLPCAADVNGDGGVDLICADQQENTLTVLTNNGSGGFVLAGTYAVGLSPISACAADVNGDGKVDLITANYHDKTLTVLTNATPFPPPSLPIITAQPIGNTNVVGESVTLEIRVTPQPTLPECPFFYQWQLNGSNLPAATNSLLLLSNLVVSQSGYYDVIISNCSGSVTSSIVQIDVQFLLATVNGQPAIGATTAVGSGLVTLSSGYENGFIFYTLDGSTPTESSALYLGPFTLTNSAVLQALAVSANFSQSTLGSPVTVQIIPVYNLRTTVSGSGNVSVNPAPGPYASNSVVALTATAAANWAFAYWTGGVTGSQNPASVTINGPLNVQAVFIPTAFPLTAGTAGGGSVTVNGQVISPSTYYPVGDVVSLSATASNGWIFLGWEGDATGTNNPLNVTMDQTNNIQAIFGTIVRVGPVGGGSIVLNAPNPIAYGTTLTASAVPNAGEYFVTWSGSASGTESPTTILVTNAIPTVDALFTTLPGGKYALAVVVSGNGAVAISPQQNYYNPGDSVTISASTTNAGTSFYGWTGNASGSNNPLVVTVSSNMVVQANFGALPSVNITPQNLIVLGGSNAVLTANAAGLPPLSYQWQDSEGAIAGQTNATFAITNAQATNTDNYSVVVSNPFGSVTSAVAMVTVVFPPSISLQPIPQAVAAGSSLALSVSAAGTAPLAYQWQNTAGAIAGATSSNLTMNPALTNCTDNYSVVVENSYGVVTSQVAAVVVYAPVSIQSQPNSLVVPAYVPATFAVSSSGFPPPISYQWSLNGTNVDGATLSSLTITNVELTNLGSYQVVVSNAYSCTTSYIATLSMSPSLTLPFAGATTYWGKNATLSVGAIGSGELSYQWYQNGLAVGGATNPTLNFTTVQFTNGGMYSVVVTSPFGTVTNVAAQMIVEPAGVSLGFSPTLTISGVVGYSYIIQGSTNLTDTNAWATVTNLTLTEPVQIWVDTNVDASSPFNPTHFYQVLPGQ